MWRSVIKMKANERGFPPRARFLRKQHQPGGGIGIGFRNNIFFPLSAKGRMRIQLPQPSPLLALREPLSRGKAPLRQKNRILTREQQRGHLNSLGKPPAPFVARLRSSKSRMSAAFQNLELGLSFSSALPARRSRNGSPPRTDALGGYRNF